MEPHNHAEYEQTFSRVATILERVVESIAGLAETLERANRVTEEQGRRGLETQRQLEQLMAHAAERDAETTDKLNGLIDLMDRHLREHREKE